MTRGEVETNSGPGEGPAISVVMPAFNSARFIRPAIESVLGQTFRDFEFIIIDDGSTDDTLKIIQDYAAKDQRIVILSHLNKGMGRSLNEAIELARGRWIARIDADDLMMPQRLERQLDYMHRHPGVAVAGSWIQYVNRRGRVIGHKRAPLHKKKNIEKLNQRNKLIPLTHPSVLMDRQAFREAGGYRPEFWPSDDLDLWSRILEHGHQIRVQREFLTQYRIHSDSICAAKARRTMEGVRWVRECLIRRRRGEREISFDEYVKWRKSLPLLRRLDENRKIVGRTMHKIATVSYAERRYIIMAAAFAWAAVLQPYLTWLGPISWRISSLRRRIVTRVFGPKKKNPDRTTESSAPPKDAAATPAYKEPRPV